MSPQIFRWQRHQHAVGHGFFHSATLTGAGALPPFHYIFDCGAKKVRGLLAPAIDEVCATLDERPIDLLMLSHFHADHVNGLDILLARKEVRRVAMPYLAESERLLLIGQLLATSTARLAEIQMAADPGGWLQSRGVESVITIQATDEVEPAQQEPQARLREDRQDGWMLRSASAVPLLARGDTAMGHRIPLNAFFGSKTVLDFHFYCWQALNLHTRMMNAWKADGAPTMTELLDPTNLATKLRSNKLRDRLVQCYHSVTQGRNLNWTTLCVLISPSSGACRVGYDIGFGATRRLWPPIWPAGMGWLGTGDLELGQAKVSEEFFNHYKDAPTVASLSLPHHGSRLNFDARLISRFEPGLAFATVPSLSTKHPDQRVLRTARREGAEVHLVDDKACNVLHEEDFFAV